MDGLLGRLLDLAVCRHAVTVCALYKRVFPRRVCWWLGGLPRACITGRVVEPSRVLVLDNWAVCKCVFLRHVCR